MSECKFKNVEYDRMWDTLWSGHFGTFNDAIEYAGPDNLPTIYDIANIKRFFLDHRCSHVLNQPSRKVRDFTDNRTFGDVKPRPGFGFNMLWTGEYLGKAPKGHPAEGKYILAKIEGIDDTKSHNEGDNNPGQIIVSDTRYALVGGLTNISQVAYDQWDGGYIRDFEEVNGLMVPVTSGQSRRFNSVFKETNGYGSILGMNDRINPIGCNSTSWSNSLTFHTNHPMNSRKTALKKSDLEALLEPKKSKFEIFL